MDKNISIVKVDKRHHRVIARENWGLTKEQMKGKHVHHRIKRSDGGTNDPSNLYVCSEWFHDNVWHAGEGGFTGCASNGGKIGGLKTLELKVGCHNPEHKGKGGKKCREIGVGIFDPVQKGKGSKKVGLENVRLGRGFCAPGVASKGGKIGGKRGSKESKRKAGKVGGSKTFGKRAGIFSREARSQQWESIVDGFRSNAAGVSRHNQSKGWDPDLKRKV